MSKYIERRLEQPAAKLDDIALYEKAAIVEALRLIVGDGQVTELRVLDAVTSADRRAHTLSGYFDDPAKLAEALAKADIISAKGVYFVPNAVEPALLARAMNRLRKAGTGDTTQDSHIIRRRYLLIDADAFRPSGVSNISATEAEHAAALAKVEVIRTYLVALGWPVPIVADSGNGGHLLYAIDLPADDSGIVQRCLLALAQRFDDEAVKIDKGVFNPARIWKMYGTRACKGDNTQDRPHRMARILSRPDELTPVAMKLLEALAAEAVDAKATPAQPSKSIAPQNGNGQPLDVAAFLERHKLDATGPKEWNGQQGRGLCWEFRTSPMCEHHGDGPFLVQHASGAITARCPHNSCTWEWSDLRRKFAGEYNGAPKGLPESDDEVLRAQDAWPDPLDDAARHGLVGEIVACIERHSEADPVAILVQTLLAFGNIIGRKAHFFAEADRHCGNLFACLVGNTSKARKGTSWGRTSRLFSAIDADWLQGHVTSGLSSGEGLIWAVRDPVTKQQPMYEGQGKEKQLAGYENVIVDEGVADKRLLVMEGEFSSVLTVAARERNTLSAIIRQAWDAGTLRTLTKNSPAQATDAHISILGHITRDELRRRISDTDLANGLANRFLWLCVHRAQLLPEGGALDDRAFAPLTERLRGAIEFAKGVNEMKRDDDARAVWHEVYPTLSEGKPGLLGAATSRAEAQAMRLAMLYALLDQSAVIRAEHLTAGLAVWSYAEQSARYIFGSALGDPMADEILAQLRRRHPDGMTRTEIRNHFGRNRPSQEIGRALGVLLDYRLARCEPRTTDGRPAEHWFAKYAGTR